MDAQARKKEFRAKLKEQARKSRIDSPLVRYNENDQPVCRVCNVTLKSESLWPAHQASKKHHEAIKDLKAKASRPNAATNSNSHQNKELPVGKPSGAMDLSKEVHKVKPSQGLPANFFDSSESKKPTTRSGSSKQIRSHSGGVMGPPPNKTAVFEQATTAAKVPEPIAVETKQSETDYSSSNVSGSEAADGQKKGGALPEGFFDNKDADLRARGIEPVKPDVNDEYKEFEKSIQDDLKEIDDRYEEEEVDAADVIEEEETVEQMSYKVKFEMLKRKRIEMSTAKSNKSDSNEEKRKKKPTRKDEASSDDDDDEDFTVDWRAQYL